ncbi:MAG: hypothetical protein DI601_19030 [Azospirillum brasilense]|nr:MAG: hypothetical protein DI601_19030 [Azospirillum brasilense]
MVRVARNPEGLFGLFILALGLAVLVGAGRIPTGFGYDTAGPRLIPYVIGGGLVLSALLVLVGVLANPAPDRPAADAPRRNGLVPLLLISAALLGEALFIERLGWVPVAAAAFAAAAWAFDDRRLALNLLIGLGFAAAILAAFTFGLGIDLPLGPLEPLLRPAE